MLLELAAGRGWRLPGRAGCAAIAGPACLPGELHGPVLWLPVLLLLAAGQAPTLATFLFSMAWVRGHCISCQLMGTMGAPATLLAYTTPNSLRAVLQPGRGQASRQPWRGVGRRHAVQLSRQARGR